MPTPAVPFPWARCAIAAIAALASHIQHACADDAEPCPYTVLVAGTAVPCGDPFPTTAVLPRGLNNRGEWVGYRDRCGAAEGSYKALLWTPEAGVQELPFPAGSVSTYAHAINDHGTVIGRRIGVTNGVSHGDWACIWSGGQFIEIPPLGECPFHSGATAINNRGVVVGWRELTDCSGQGYTLCYGFLWEAGNITHVDPSAYGFDSAVCTDISEIGLVVGQLAALTQESIRGFRLQAGQVEILEPLPGAINSNALGVNDAGLAVGACRFAAVDTTGVHYMPTIWAVDGGPQALQILDGYSSSMATNASNDGLIMGWANKPLHAGLAQKQFVLWFRGVPHALGDLLGMPSVMQPAQAWAMNDLGEVLCTSGGAQVAPAGSAWIMSPTQRAADLNGDCRVDGSDIGLLLQSWGARGSIAADLDHDGSVDGADLGLLLGAWSGR